jgi:predicted nucleotidyltransferase
MKREIQKIVNQIVKNYKPEEIILFGSFAYGKPKENSDVDLVVIKKTRKKFIKRLFEVCKYIDSWLGTDILVYTPKEWKEALEEENYFIKEIAKKGKVVYAKERKNKK